MKNEISINNLNSNIKREKQIINEEANREEKIERKNNEELIKSDNISYKDLVKIVLNTKAELSQTKKELSETNKKLLTRIENLETNQKLMYYQISMYHSRDISKNIYFYFAEHLKIKNHDKPFFDLLEIMDYLKKSGNKTNYLDEDKTNLRKFFKSLFFVNKVNNRTMHNNLTTRLQRVINAYKTDEDDGLLSLLPPTSFDQLFTSLFFYVENNTKDQLLQKVMKHVYENEYINDKGLKDI